jgi:hypothetical protein
VAEQRGEGGGDDEERDEKAAQDRRRIPDEPPRGVAPEAAGGRFERDFVGFELGDAHE